MNFKFKKKSYWIFIPTLSIIFSSFSMLYSSPIGSESGVQMDDCAPVNISVNATAITINNLVAPAAVIQILDENNDQVAGCTFNCSTVESFDLPVGTYRVSVKKFNTAFTQICEKVQNVTVVGTLKKDQTLRLFATPQLDQKTELVVRIPQNSDVKVTGYTLEYLHETDDSPTSIYIISEEVLQEESKLLNFTHEQRKAGKSYYRIKAEYADGRIDYTPYKLVSNSEIATSMAMKIMSTPVRDQLSINFQAIKGQNYRLAVIDLLSKTQHEQTFIGEEGGMLLDVNSSNWKGGIYYLLLESEVHTEVKQIVVVK